MPRSTLARATSFAHLIGFGAKSADEDEDDKEKKAPDASEDEDDKEKDPNASEEDDKDKKGPDAEDDDEDNDPDASEDDDEDEDKDPKARAARKAGAKAERARCAAIFGSKHAVGRVASAAHLAFNTGMSARAAVNLLKTLPTQGSAGTGLSDRMAGHSQLRTNAGGAPAPSKKAQVAASWDVAATTAGIKPRKA